MVSALRMVRTSTSARRTEVAPRRPQVPFTGNEHRGLGRNQHLLLLGRELHHAPVLVGIAQGGEDLAAGAEVGVAAMRSLDGAVERQRDLGERGRRHSAATARPICSQVGATSETVARRMSRAKRWSSNSMPRCMVQRSSQITRSFTRQRWE